MKKHQIKSAGFTLLELIIVLFLIALIFGFSAPFFASILPSVKIESTAREISSIINYARSLARMSGNLQVIIIDFDSKTYSLEGQNIKQFPSDIRVMISDPISGKVCQGKYRLLFHAAGGMEGGTIIIANDRKSITIKMDPVKGSVVSRNESSRP